ncbi:MarR family winged helix-turn-helix transcriptional regulator [Anaeromicrobium sediminis]|uniref:HTH marR-type domain-containing protein n=1 Tax=Anaeromicrobium sediminis TaxID=1478221 RepID=A0A267MIC3_9FIRM|nr:winged helix DNA-binding protein [Anaeromicrobium sediminis]PAB59331.1 hypothetical protein CCE28_10745 [Anaeromicrobium sediminis]
MANYYNEINNMINKLIQKIIYYDTKGFKVGKDKELGLIDVYILRSIGLENKKIYEVVKEIGVDRSLVATSLKKLSTYGYVIKEKSVEDKRAYVLRLTEEGVELYHKTWEIQSDILNFILETTTLNEEKAILKFLSKINQTTFESKKELEDY